MRLIHTLVAFAALAASAPVLAKDRIVDVSNPTTVRSLVLEAGYKAELKKGDEGNPYIVSAANGNEFQIVFYGCKAEVACGSYEFYSWYKKDPLFTLEFVNEWNAKKRFLKVAIDKDGDLAEYLYASAVGNTTYANFADTLDWFAEMDAELSLFIKEKRAALKASPTPAPAK